VNYYAVYRPSALYRALRVIDAHLVQWARRKYKRLNKHRHRAWEWLRGLQSRVPRLLPHWWAAIREFG
jgi:RNA-directed DNA polymerase